MEFGTFAYLMRAWGYFSASVAITVMGIRNWGIRRWSIAELTKVLPHMVLSLALGIRREKPVWLKASRLRTVHLAAVLAILCPFSRIKGRIEPAPTHRHSDSSQHLATPRLILRRSRRPCKTTAST